MRERLSLDRGWRFALGHAANAALDFDFARDRSLVKAGEARGAAGKDFDDAKWRQIDLPHDWAIELPLDPRGDKEVCDHGFVAIGPDHPEHSVGWYRRTFDIPKSDLGRRISVEFDGVFRDSIVWINGHRLGRHASGYTGFRFDLTDYLNYGGKNVLVLRVDASQWEGWWYEGAGIYRHVWLVKTDVLHVAPNGTFVTSKLRSGSAMVTIQTTVANDGDDDVKFTLESEIEGRHSKTNARIAPWASVELRQTIQVKNPRLWSCETPNLYAVKSSLSRKSARPVDRVETAFGIRTLRWDAKRGFFLNGKPVKIKGTCNHQHHAGVGTAMPDALHEWRLSKLKEMGSNAYRCSHYAVAPELLDLCDRMGILVMAETRRAGSEGEAIEQFEQMIRRDRNHASIVLWSIGNEEHSIQWAVAGERIGRAMVRRAHQLDPTRMVTAAMHDKGLDVGFANVVDVHGWNYMKVGDIEAFHKRRPNQPIVGSEESSLVTTRGIYADDKARGYVSAYDVRTPGWGMTAEKWWTYVVARPWIAGAFVWIGFDHRGEPIPYKWPCTGSHFGLMDSCGFPKDIYYYYKTWWTDEPVLHLFPHWNWAGSEGREIDVHCFTNCDEVELLVNDRSHGRKSVERNSHVAWKVIYEPGAIEAVGYRTGKRAESKRIETTSEPKRLHLFTDRDSIRADGEHVISIAVSALDERDRPVPTADHLVRFALDGPAQLIGVGNGDPSSHESDKAPMRRLFSGLAMAIVRAGRKAGTIRLTATSEGLEPAGVTISAKRAAVRPFVP